jgi:hypothetical protein
MAPALRGSEPRPSLFSQLFEGGVKLPPQMLCLRPSRRLSPLAPRGPGGGKRREAPSAVSKSWSVPRLPYGPCAFPEGYQPKANGRSRARATLALARLWSTDPA